MKVNTLALATGVLALTGAANADFVGAHVTDLGDIGGGVSTWEVYLDFSSPTDQLIAVSGNAAVSALQFNSLDGDALVNSGAALGSNLEDTPFFLSDAWDSWVTIGDQAADTSFSPGFLGGPGTTAVIVGTSFSQADNGGYFDSNPGTAALGASQQIAQFTVANFSYSGTVAWQGTGAGATLSSFSVTTAPVPAPGAFALLGLAGIAARRRRRG